MPNISNRKRKTQNHVVKFFWDKLYYHIGLLKQGCSDKLVVNAVDFLLLFAKFASL